jgi:hypothetical protein
MVAYNTLDNRKVDAMDETKGNVHKNPLMSAYLIEKIVKQYKNHQSAADFDSGFVDKVIDAMKGLVRTRDRKRITTASSTSKVTYNENINENKILIYSRFCEPVATGAEDFCVSRRNVHILVQTRQKILLKYD